LIRQYLTSQALDKDYIYWDKAIASKKPTARRPDLVLAAKEINVRAQEIASLLDQALAKVEVAISKAKIKGRQLYHPYFINQPLAWET